MKAVGDEATIRWYGPLVPSVGEVLRTPTGRQYLVVEKHGRTQRALKCVVMPPASKVTFENTREMYWIKRRRKGRR